MASTPEYAPDGMLIAGRVTERFVGTAASDSQDDGLVHKHAWARSETINKVAAASGGMFLMPSLMCRFHHQTPMPTLDGHDDGRVHNHIRAMSGQ